MRTSRVALAAAVLAGATAIGFGVSIGTASADTFAALPIKSFGDIAVDGVHKRVFVSDPTTGKIVATDFRGRSVGELGGLTGVDGLALSADSNLLYAAVRGANKVVAVSTTTVTASDSYELGASVRLTDVAAPVNGKLWFSGEVAVLTGGFGSIDLATRAVQVHDNAVDGISFSAGARLFTGTSAPGLLVLAETAMSAGNSAVYDISSGAETLKLKTDWLNEAVLDLDLTGEGTRLLPVTYNGVRSIDLADGAQQRIFNDLRFFGAADVAHDGRIAVGVHNTTDAADVHVYQDGAATAEKTFSLGLRDIADHGLAWEPGGSILFAVSDSGDFRLHVLNDPTSSPDDTPSGPPLELHMNFIGAPLTAPRNVPLTFSGFILAAGNIPLPAGSELTVTRTDMESPAGRSLGTVRTDADGMFPVADTPTSGGAVRYTFAYAGSTRFAPMTGDWTVEVSRGKTSLTLARSPQPAVYTYGSTVTLSAKLGATYKNRSVEFWADPYGADQPARLLKRVTVDAAGRATATIKPTRTTAVSARFTGDPGYLPTSVGFTLLTRVNASTALSRHYKTAKIGKTTYQFFRKSKDPLITQTMTPHPGRKVRTIIEYYSGGKWRLWSGRETRLSTTGKASFTFVTGVRVGRKFRVRAEYIPGKAGDSLNYGTQGAWKYFTYTK
ncbi:hypothetical protein [Actinoplanes subglobosus]|uniref:Ig-like domain repeat protein n=1 Tax=Actinoplanes subglobosus TaxID=1547892 RepID=A0ABV8IP55_9ACTN